MKKLTKKLFIIAMIAAGTALSKPAFAMENFTANSQNYDPSTHASTKMSVTTENDLKDFSKTIINLIKKCDKMIYDLEKTKEQTIAFNEISAKIFEILNPERSTKNLTEEMFKKLAYDNNFGLINPNNQPTNQEAYNSRKFLVNLYKIAHKRCEPNKKLINNPLYSETETLIKQISLVKTAIISKNQELILKNPYDNTSIDFNSFEKQAIEKVKNLLNKTTDINSRAMLDTCYKLIDNIINDENYDQIDVVIKLLGTYYDSKLDDINQLISSAKQMVNVNMTNQYIKHKLKLEKYYKENISRYTQILTNICSSEPKNEKSQKISSCNGIIKEIISALNQLDIDLINISFNANIFE